MLYVAEADTGFPKGGGGVVAGMDISYLDIS